MRMRIGRCLSLSSESRLVLVNTLELRVHDRAFCFGPCADTRRILTRPLIEEMFVMVLMAVYSLLALPLASSGMNAADMK